MDNFTLKFERCGNHADRFRCNLVLCRMDGEKVKAIVTTFADRFEYGWRHDGTWNIYPRMEGLPYMPEASAAEYAAALETAMRTYVKEHRMPTVLRLCAITAGIVDKSYDTVRFGWIERFEGEVNFAINGVEYHAVGRGPVGSAEFAMRRTGNLNITPNITPMEL